MVRLATRDFGGSPFVVPPSILWVMRHRWSLSLSSVQQDTDSHTENFHSDVFPQTERRLKVRCLCSNIQRSGLPSEGIHLGKHVVHVVPRSPPFWLMSQFFNAHSFWRGCFEHVQIDVSLIYYCHQISPSEDEGGSEGGGNSSQSASWWCSLIWINLTRSHLGRMS